MISLIICSRTGSLSDALTANIRATIGVPYETIVIDNAQNRYSIFEAYNLGVSKSNYPVLCFMHDDIEYHTQNWGQNILMHFNDEQTGAIGIAGSPYVTDMPGSWWGGGMVNETVGYNYDGVFSVVTKSVSSHPVAKSVAAVIDGVWMCIRKDLFKNIAFDEINFSGFHFYDVDISMQIQALGFNIYTITDVLVVHFSKGDVNTAWIENAWKFNKKWRRQLPLDLVKVNYWKACDIAIKTLHEFVQILASNNIDKQKAYRLGLSNIIRFYKGYFYYKTPVYAWRYLLKSFVGQRSS